MAYSRAMVDTSAPPASERAARQRDVLQAQEHRDRERARHEALREAAERSGQAGKGIHAANVPKTLPLGRALRRRCS